MARTIGALGTLLLTAKGQNYKSGNRITLYTAGSTRSALINIDAVDGAGGVTAYHFLDRGATFTIGDALIVQEEGTSGSGGSVLTFALRSGGTGYVAGQQQWIVGYTESPADLLIDTVNGVGAITAAHLLTPGSGYLADQIGAGLTHPVNPGFGATVDITVRGIGLAFSILTIYEDGDPGGTSRDISDWLVPMMAVTGFALAALGIAFGWFWEQVEVGGGGFGNAKLDALPWPLWERIDAIKE